MAAASRVPAREVAVRRLVGNKIRVLTRAETAEKKGCVAWVREPTSDIDLRPMQPIKVGPFRLGPVRLVVFLIPSRTRSPSGISPLQNPRLAPPQSIGDHGDGEAPIRGLPSRCSPPPLLRWARFYYARCPASVRFLPASPSLSALPRGLPPC